MWSVPKDLGQHEIQIDEYDAADDLIGTTRIQADAYFYANLGFSSVSPSNILALITPNSTAGHNAAFVRREDVVIDSEAAIAASPGASSILSLGAYVPGSRRRVKSGTVSASDLNTVFHGFHLGQTQGSGATRNSQWGFAVAFRDGVTFTKENTHTLKLGFELSWDRDYLVT